MPGRSGASITIAVTVTVTNAPGFMSENKLKVIVDELRHGMWVAELDRPWLDTPFLLQGFEIKDQDDLDTLIKYCSYVYIDLNRTPAHLLASVSRNNAGAVRKHQLIAEPVEYRDIQTLEEELPRAKESHAQLSATLKNFFSQIATTKKIDITGLRDDLNVMVESVIRNPDAYALLARLRKKDEYTYSHSISCAVWAVAFGRQLGLPKAQLQELALGATLFDIGKLQVPKDILSKKTRLSEEELDIIRMHVEFGLEMLATEKKLSNTVRDMVAHHHERFDGSGYPKRLKGNAIPLAARIAAIVDCYDAITTSRPFQTPVSPSAAIKKLYEWRGRDFQPELIEEFIQAIGVYPAGTLVELTTGEVAVVVAESRTRRLRPKVMLVLNANKQMLDNFSTVDLLSMEATHKGQPIEIAHAVEPGTYGIDPSTLYI